MTTMNLYIVLICLLIIPFSKLSAQDIDYKSNFEKGLKAYKNKEYAQSVKFYESALSSEIKSPEAYNNLGLAYFKTADIGRSVLSFERALRMRPGYSSARKNLKAAQQYIDSKVKKSNGFWLFGFFVALSQILSSFAWSMVFFLLFFSASASLLIWYLKLNEKLSFIGLRVGIIFLLFSILSFGFARSATIAQFDKKDAIVIAVRAGVRTAPGLDGEDILVISSGVKVKIQEEMGDWYKIRLENAVVGWVPLKTIEKI